MKRADVAREVLAAVERGEIPRGGPSEAAALGVLDELPEGYWKRWGEDAAQRIRSGLVPLEDGGE